MFQPYPIPLLAAPSKTNNYLGGREYLFNMGGPRTRNRIEHISSSLLANSTGKISCPLVISLGLDFGENAPVPTMERMLEEEGFTQPEELRKHFLSITNRYICHAAFFPNRLSVEISPRGNVLQQAVLLGLCTATFFDPARPILWTNASLTRCLDLFDTGGLYA